MADDDDNDEAERDFLLNPENWPDEADTENWITYSLKLLKVEINCALDHMKELEGAVGEDRNVLNYKVAKHLECLREGVYTTSNVHLRSLPFEITVELAREKLEVQTGVPYDVIEVPGIGTMFKARPFVAPDTLEGLDNGEG